MTDEKWLVYLESLKFCSTSLPPHVHMVEAPLEICLLAFTGYPGCNVILKDMLNITLNKFHFIIEM